MWPFDDARYGRPLMGAAVLFLLLACERQRPHARTIEEVVAAARTVRPVENPPPKSVRLAPTEAVALDALPEEASSPVPEVTDRGGPDTLSTWQWSTTQWDSLTAEWNKGKDFYSITKLGRFRLVEGLEPPRLFYRVAAHDSAWTEIDLALPQEEIHWGMESRGTDLDTINLDGRGAAELVLRCRPAAYGSGGGTEWDHVSILDVSSTPTLVFRALLAAEEESFAGYATMHGIKMAPGEEFTGCKTKIGDCNLTQLHAGRYRYQNGRIFRVRR